MKSIFFNSGKTENRFVVSRVPLVLLVSWGIFAFACASHSAKPAGPAPKCTVANTEGCQEILRQHESSKKTSPSSGGVEAYYEGMGQEKFQDEPEDLPEHVIGEEVEKETSEVEKDPVPQFDIPITINARVEKWIDYFQGRGRKVMKSWMGSPMRMF